jgi:hypothetical protein
MAHGYNHTVPIYRAPAPSAFAVAVAVVAYLAGPVSTALAGPITPESGGSPNAEDIDKLHDGGADRHDGDARHHVVRRNSLVVDSEACPVAPLYCC